jgi:16S rRNA processing protein RimM
VKPSPRTTGARAEADRAAADEGARRAPRSPRPAAAVSAGRPSHAREASLGAASADAEPFDWPADAVEVGRIVDAWGVQGGLRVQPFSGDPQALFSSRRWLLRPPEAAAASPKAASAGAPRLLHVSGAREQGDGIVANSRDLPDRNAAEALRGWRIFVSRGSFPSTAEDEYYWVDLIGLEVVNREGASLGTVADLMDTGAHSVLRVTQAASGEPGREAERLIPFVAAYVDEVSLERRRITVDWGLDY